MVTRPTVHSTASQYTYTYSTYPSYPTNHPSCSRVHVQYSARARGCPGRKPPPAHYPCHIHAPGVAHEFLWQRILAELPYTPIQCPTVGIYTTPRSSGLQGLVCAIPESTAWRPVGFSLTGAQPWVMLWAIPLAWHVSCES